ncbi:MAG TPA: SDR family oxidoreductase [Acetobacteraceae bacterium]|jgi:NAD(P)-dependent dehydrogenase (short-subunit alcohol dehydrogenase family)|nr:SDR family oxidoreductase [Acetobacteraceae bacterium]
MARVALVTGGASGIGAACAHALREDGLTVVPTDRHGVPHVMDVTDEAAVEHSFDDIEAEFGPVAVLVTCAGTIIVPPDRRPLIADIVARDWDETFRVNTRGTFFAIRAMLRRRRAKPVTHARIVTISSAAGQTGGARGGADYAASKAAVLALTKQAAREAASLGLTVNSVAPGPIETPLYRSVNPIGADQAVVATVPLGRVGTPEEVAAAVRYLVSEAAAYVTGSVIDVNGGSRMQ